MTQHAPIRRVAERDLAHPPLIIARVDAIPVALPLQKPMKMAGETIAHAKNIVVRIEAADGTVGWGEAASAPTMTGDTLGGLTAAVRDHLGPRLVGKDAWDRSALVAMLRAALIGNTGAHSAIEMALLDLAGRQAGLPLIDLLGGAVSHAVAPMWLLGNDTPQEDVAEAVAKERKGFLFFKLSATLVLRSKEINEEGGGLAHLVEHTSFTGAAGTLSADQVKELFKDCIQVSDATTQPGVIKWQASFLPKYLEQVLGFLAVTSLDQKFDVESVRAEARIVLQELYLGKYHTKSRHQRMIDAALFGSSHPYGSDTMEAELAKAKTPPERLAAELRDYAQTIRLPANMDLFIVGGLDPVFARTLVEKCFGRYPFAKGPMLDIPKAAVTGGYRAFAALSPELRRPLSEIKIAWNTGICVTHPDARVVLALSEYLEAMVLDQLREKHGDTYTPEVSYEPDDCAGIFEIAIRSTEPPHTIEAKLFEGVGALKANIDDRELGRFRDSLELQRRKIAESNDALLKRMVDRAVQGGSIHDLDLETVSRDEVLAAARKYLPSHRGPYVRLSLRGQ